MIWKLTCHLVRLGWIISQSFGIKLKVPRVRMGIPVGEWILALKSQSFDPFRFEHEFLREDSALMSNPKKRELQLCPGFEQWFHCMYIRTCRDQGMYAEKSCVVVQVMNSTRNHVKTRDDQMFYPWNKPFVMRIWSWPKPLSGRGINNSELTMTTTIWSKLVRKCLF